jgi:hypothetical protein
MAMLRPRMVRRRTAGVLARLVRAMRLISTPGRALSRCVLLSIVRLRVTLI